MKKFLGSNTGGNVLGFIFGIGLFILIGFVLGIGGAIGGAIAGGVGFVIGNAISGVFQEKEDPPKKSNEE